MAEQGGGLLVVFSREGVMEYRLPRLSVIGLVNALSLAPARDRYTLYWFIVLPARVFARFLGLGEKWAGH